MKNASRTLRLVTTGSVVQDAHVVVVLAVRAASAASVTGVAFLPVPVLVQVICKAEIGIVFVPVPKIGPAGEETVKVADPVGELRSEPVTVVVEHAKFAVTVSVGEHVIVELLIEIEASAAAVTATEKGALEVAAWAGTVAAPSAIAKEAATAIRFFKVIFRRGRWGVDFLSPTSTSFPSHFSLPRFPPEPIRLSDARLIP
jgi:hypothetical protein